MSSSKHFLGILLCCLCTSTLWGQDSDNALQTAMSPHQMEEAEAKPSIIPLLAKMSLEEKSKLLDYLRYQGANIDQAIINAFEQIPPESQKKVQLYAYTIQLENNSSLRTYVKWNHDTLYLGKIAQGMVISDSLVVENIGVNPYIITEIISSCDCTVLNHPDFPLMPAEKMPIKFQFDTKGKIGPFEIGIVVRDNSRPNIRSILYLMGEVVRNP